MKKILAILSLLVFLPFSAYAMQMIHDDAMDEITGQCGITIEMDMDISVAIASLTWFDCDGVGAYNNPTFFALLGTTVSTLHVETMTNYAGIDIDVGSDPSDNYYSSLGTLPAGLPFVRIGITDLDMSIAKITTDFSGPVNINGVTVNGVNGYIDIGGIMGMEVPGSAGSMNSLGIEINLGLGINTVIVGAVSWTDNDGIRVGTRGAATTADDAQGSVGITGLAITGMSVAGAITVECGTDATNRPTGSQTFLDIGIKNLAVGMNLPSITIALGAGPNTLNEVMGTLGLGGMTVNINGDVQISAH